MTMEQAIATSTGPRSLGSPPALEMGSLARPRAERRHDFEVLDLLLGMWPSARRVADHRLGAEDLT